jgi:hypothetical protein
MVRSVYGQFSPSPPRDFSGHDQDSAEYLVVVSAEAVMSN